MILFLFFVPVPNAFDYHNSFKLKKHLAKNKNDPKIYFLGGSAITFGVDSEVIFKNTRRNIVNLGIAGGYGLKYILDSNFDFFNSSDIVIFVPEYHHYFGDRFYGSSLSMNWSIYFNFENLKFLSYKQYKKLIEMTPDFLIAKFGLLINWMKDIETNNYSLSNFNNYGDYLIDGTRQRKNFDGQKIDLNLDKYVFEYLKNYAIKLNEMNVDIYIYFPPITKSLYINNTNLINNIYNEFINIDDLKTINEPTFFDDSHFYDSNYHMNINGKKKNTALMLEHMVTIFKD